MRIVLAASLLLLAGCASHDKAAATSTDPNVVLASSGGSGCHGAAKAELASMEGGKSCSAKKAEMASSDGAKSCSAKKAEMASSDGAKSCHGGAVKAELASSEGAKSCHSGAVKAELASADSHTCGHCPTKADGSCDHEAGAKAGRDCCKAQLAKTATP